MIALLAGKSQSDDSWPQFRGPDGQGRAAEHHAPVDFSMEKSVRWKTDIPGKGWSSPVYKDGRVWLTTADAKPATAEEQARKLAGDPLKNIKEVAAQVQLRAICVDLESGEVLHDRPLRTVEDPDPINPLNTFASPTAAIDGNRVFCHFGTYGTWCLDSATGKELWNSEIKIDHSVGPGSSPFVIGDKLILVYDGTDQQFIVGLDTQTGREVWRTARPPMRATNVEYHKAYSTPIAIQVNGKTQVVIPGSQWICGYQPDTGEEIWRVDHGDGFSTSPSAVQTRSGLVVFSTGYMRPELVAVRPDGTGDVTHSHLIWRSSRNAPTMPSPIAVGQHIYMISDGGILTKLRAADGSIVWQERLEGNFSASPILVGDKLYFCSREGTVTVTGTSDEYHAVATNQLEPRLMASPAVVGSDLLIRTEQSLIRIGG